MDEKNRELRAAKHEPMVLEEAIGARLYSGPMYEKYNLVLRSRSGNEYMLGRFKKECQGNTYTTTLHAINSAVVKLSKLTQAVPVYRGQTKAKLPARHVT